MDRVEPIQVDQIIRSTSGSNMPGPNFGSATPIRHSDTAVRGEVGICGVGGDELDDGVGEPNGGRRWPE